MIVWGWGRQRSPTAKMWGMEVCREAFVMGHPFGSRESAAAERRSRGGSLGSTPSFIKTALQGRVLGEAEGFVMVMVWRDVVGGGDVEMLERDAQRRK